MDKEEFKKKFRTLDQKKFIDFYHQDLPTLREDKEKAQQEAITRQRRRAARRPDYDANKDPAPEVRRPRQAQQARRRAERVIEKQAQPSENYKDLKKAVSDLLPVDSALDKKATVAPAEPIINAPPAAPEKTQIKPDKDVFPPFPDKTLEDEIAKPSEEPKAPAVARTRKYTRPKGELFTPSMHDLVKYFQMPIVADGEIKKIKNEENASVILPLAYIRKISFGIEGLAGSAKTCLMDRLLELVIPDSVYTLTSASDKALYYKKDEINAHDWLYVTEMQKCMNLVEQFKTLAEGKDANHEVKLGKATEKITLNKKPICFTRAYDNRWDLDNELRRRFLIIDSTTTPEETEEITKDILENCHKIVKKSRKDEALVDSIKVHLEKLYQKEDLLFYDPYSDCLAEIIPVRNSRLKAYLSHYLKLVQASAKFHLNDRMQFKHGQNTYVVLELEDHYNVFRAYHKDFINVLEHLNQGNGDDEVSAEFGPFKKVDIDWSKWAKKGYEFMKNHEDAEVIRKFLPNFVDKWYDKQSSDGAFWVLDYKTGKEIKIADAPVTEV